MASDDTTGGPLDADGMKRVTGLQAADLVEDGMRVGLGTGTGRTTTDSMANQFIVVMSGKTAMIEVGTTYAEQVPLLIFEPGAGNVWLSQTYRLARAGAYLEVRPTDIPGGLVRVDLTQVLSYYDEEKKVLKLTRLSTTVIVPKLTQPLPKEHIERMFDASSSD